MKFPKIISSKKRIFFGVYTLVAFLAVHIGNENSFLEIIRIPSYYSDLFLALSCSFALAFYLNRLSKWLEKKFSWDGQSKPRLKAQILYGVLFPTVLLLSIEAVYLSMINIRLEDSSILYLELPIIFVLCLTINLGHIVLYQNTQVKRLQQLPTVEEPQDSRKENFIVQVGKGFLKIPMEEVAYFKIQNKLTFLITQNGQSYLYDYPFKEIIEDLPSESFFQLNRQVIAKRNSIVKSLHTNTRRLQIQLSPSIDEQVFVAKTKASVFLNWLQSA